MERWKKFLISHSWELDKHPVDEEELIDRHPELEIIVGSLSQEEIFFLKVGRPDALTIIESNW